MIFVTVGTHEQQFNRLVEYMDKWSMSNTEEVVIQSGFSSYQPKNARWSKLFPYQDMVEMVNKARIVITHGGPSSFLMPLQIGKIPIVVPRTSDLEEHVNNHQIDFCRKVAERQGNIIVVEDIAELGNIIAQYDELIGELKNKMTSNNTQFCEAFSKIVDGLVK